ncbi:MAG: homoserine dehydrogenase [Cellulomonadaceae bacterium]|jgi:homoserine dehydrogenase|nr:homoserine dehydrogenase [Cellulomonadaceae bacterium]
METQTPLKVVLLGCGVVGSQVAAGLLSENSHLAARIGAPIELTDIVVRDVNEITDPQIPKELLTTDANKAVDNADIVIELFGGIEPARTLILRALNNGASVITANKALLANHGPELYQAAANAGVDLQFEASVGGAIPIIRPIRDSLAGDHVQRILGIVNGTTNFVLEKMATEGLELSQAVKVAQDLGYAEADPSADVDGVDAAAKAAILASLAFHTRVGIDDVATEGIGAVTPEDLAWAKHTHKVLKLLAIAERTPAGLSVRVHPALISRDHPLAAVRGAFNAVFIDAQAAGPLMFYGQGAGGVATSSAVLGDFVAAARHMVQGGKVTGESTYARLPVLSAGASRSRFQIRLVVADQPGVLQQVAGLLADNQVSIASVNQHPIRGDKWPDGAANLVITTHTATESALEHVLRDLRALEPVREVLSVLRVIGDENG